MPCQNFLFAERIAGSMALLPAFLQDAFVLARVTVFSGFVRQGPVSRAHSRSGQGLRGLLPRSTFCGPGGSSSTFMLLPINTLYLPYPFVEAACVDPPLWSWYWSFRQDGVFYAPGRGTGTHAVKGRKGRAGE